MMQAKYYLNSTSKERRTIASCLLVLEENKDASLVSLVAACRWKIVIRLRWDFSRRWFFLLVKGKIEDLIPNICKIEMIFIYFF